MTITDARRQDRRLAIRAIAALTALLLVVGLSGLLDTSSHRPDKRSGERLISGLTTTPRLIDITTAEHRYQLKFDGEHWVIPERADFPVITDRISTLLDALSTAGLDEPKTRLAERHGFLGLGDPLSGGNGALISFPETKLPPVIVGRRNGTDYARRANSSESWSLDTSFPALHSAEWWIDLDTLGLPRALPARLVEISHTGEAGRRVFPADPASLTGEDRILLQAVAALKLIDVTRFDPERLAPFAAHRVIYQNEQDLTVSLYRLDNSLWASFAGTALGEQELAKDRLFRLDPLSASDLLPD